MRDVRAILNQQTQVNTPIVSISTEDRKVFLENVSVGMEIEYSSSRIINQGIVDRYIGNRKAENSYIYEDLVKPTHLRNIRNVLRKYAFLSYEYIIKEKFDYYYREGSYDQYSESNHLHIVLKNYKGLDYRFFTVSENKRLIFNLVKVFLPFFSRTSQTFRVNSSRRLDLYFDNFTEDSKTCFLAYKYSNKLWLEIRGNENIFPMFIYLFIPVYHLIIEKQINRDIELTEFERELITNIKDLGMTVRKYEPIFALRELRKRENKTLFLKTMSMIFQYAKEYHNFEENPITSKRILDFYLEYYKQFVLFFINMKSENVFESKDPIEYNDEKLRRISPNLKIVKTALKYLIQYDRTAQNIFQQLYREDERQKLFEFINS